MTPAKTRRGLNLPPAERVQYSTNYVRLAVCELRFPTVLELETSAPRSFSKAIRSEFPTYEWRTQLSLTAAGPSTTGAHTYVSKKGRWTISVRPAGLSVETSRYSSFEEFKKQLMFVAHAASDMIDSSFYTRVGLRYVNVIPFNAAEIGGWMSPDLVGPLAGGIFGDPEEHWQRVRGITNDGGGFIFQHGITAADTPEYAVDSDFFREDVAVEDLLMVVDALHTSCFQMFKWAFGNAGIERLGTPLASKKE